MATASEIKVTEAYIGLFGRAPNPEGLAYWVAQLDAAGGTTDALKKLTNDMTGNTEWTEGALGSLVAADGSITQANAVTIVEGLYTNLFGRDSTEADETYWTAELVAGTVTASEMVVLLIAAAQEKGNADSQTLALKEDAASYYAANVVEADFNRTTAKASVEGVDSPQTVATSKAATDAIATGTGASLTLKTTTDDLTTLLTGGDDTVTGTVGDTITFQGADIIVDGSTTDNDTLTITGNGDVTSGTTTNIENTNITLGKVTSSKFTVNATKMGDTNLTLDIDELVTVGSSSNIAGETRLDLTAWAGSNLTTSDITAMTLSLGNIASQTMSFDADMSDLTVTGLDSNDTSITLANNDVTLEVTGSTAANDAMSITADNEVDVTFTTEAVENITLSGSNGALTVTLGDAGVDAANVNDQSDVTYTIVGDNDVNLIGGTSAFSASATAGANLVNSGSGDVSVTYTIANTEDETLEGLGVLGGGLTVAGLATGQTAEVNVASGNTVTSTNVGVLTLDANDTATTSTITLNQMNSADGITFKKFESVTIDANDSAPVDLNLLTGGGASVTIASDNDVSLDSVADVNVLNVTALDINLDDDIAGAGIANDIILTATNDVTAAAGEGTISIDDDLTVTAVTGDATLDQITVVGAAADTADIKVTAGDDVTFAGVVGSTAGSLTAKGDDVNVNADVTLTLGNISLESTGNDVTLATGKAVIATAGTLTIVAANDVDVNSTETDGLKAAHGITVTAGLGIDIDATMTTTNNDISLTGLKVETSTLVAGTGDITVNATNDKLTDISVITAVTSAGDLTLENGYLKLGASDLSGSLIINGDSDFLSTGAIGANAVILSTSNDVTFTGQTLTTGLVAGGGSGDFNLGTIENTGTGDLSISTGAGNDTMVLDDDADLAKYIVTAGDGINNITITDVGAGSTVTTGGGADIISVGDATKVVLSTGAGDDIITTTAVTELSLDAGTGSDTLVLGTGAVTGSITNVGFVALSGATANISSTIIDNDGDFEVTTAGTITVTMGGDLSVDLSQIDTAFGVAPTFTVTGDDGGADTVTGTAGIDTINGRGGADIINGAGGADIINGGDAIDTINGGTGADKITGAAGADILTGGTGNDEFIFDAVAATNGVDIIKDFTVAGGDEDKFDLTAYLTTFAVANVDAVASSTADDVMENDHVFVVNYDGDISGVNFGTAGAAGFDLLFDAADGYLLTTKGDLEAVIIVQGDDETHVYYLTNDNVAAIDAGDVTQVSILGSIDNTDALVGADNFIAA